MYTEQSQCDLYCKHVCVCVYMWNARSRIAFMTKLFPSTVSQSVTWRLALSCFAILDAQNLRYHLAVKICALNNAIAAPVEIEFNAHKLHAEVNNLTCRFVEEESGDCENTRLCQFQTPFTPRTTAR